MKYTLSLRLKNEEGTFFGPGPARLLTLIEGGDSLHQAAVKMGMAYSKAWRIISHAEKELGFSLLTRQRGGTGGGGSALTEDARLLLSRYNKYEEEMYQLGDMLFAKYFKSYGEKGE